MLRIDLATGAVTRGGKELTRGDVIDLTLESLFPKSFAQNMTATDINGTGTLQVSINENDEFFFRRDRR
jgi:hypothetical protein